MCNIEELCLETIDNTWWGIVLELVITFLAFVALAIVCDEYMVSSLETLCVRWHVREDVAGASFMAFGSAAPEIVINTVTTVKSVMNSGGDSDTSDADLGVASIIGSGMIAFLLIPGACGIVADSTLILKRRPLARDIGVYLISLGCLIWFFQDSMIDIVESSILVGIYVIYIFLLVISPKIREWHRRREYAKRGETLLAKESFVLQGKQGQIQDDDAQAAKVDEEKGSIQELEDQNFLTKFMDLVSAPFRFLFDVTMFDVALGKKHENLYLLTFCISMVWTAFFSFVIATTVSRWVVLSGGSMAFFGLIFVAIGAQIPDSVSSIATAKRGYGSMAVSCSLGSQITNILIGMGLPWFCAALAQADVRISDHSFILMTSYVLTGGAMVLTAITLGQALFRGANKALLGKAKGWFLVGAYLASILLVTIILYV